MDKKILFAAAVFLCFSGIIYFSFFQRSKDEETINVNAPKGGIMKISSPAFQNNGVMPEKYTCDGENVNPPLAISGVPKNSKSLVLIVDDPDAPRGAWTHWVVINITPETSEIKENSVPDNSRETLTSFGKPGYGGPCPPSGTHRYFFKLYALDAKLDLAPDDTKDKIEKAMVGHILDQAEIFGLYSQKSR